MKIDTIIQETAHATSYCSGITTCILAGLAKYEAAISSITLIIGALISLSTFVVYWYYKHKNSKKQQ